MTDTSKKVLDLPTILQESKATSLYVPRTQFTDNRRGKGIPRNQKRTLGPVEKVNGRYPVQNLWDRHREIIRLCLLGFTDREIADRMAMTLPAVKGIIESPIVQNQLAILNASRDMETEDVAVKIANLAPKAIDVLEELMDCEQANVRLGAAKDLLDRAGHGAVKKVDARITHATITPELLREMKERAAAAAKESGQELCEVLPSTH